MVNWGRGCSVATIAPIHAKALELIGASIHAHARVGVQGAKACE